MGIRLLCNSDDDGILYPRSLAVKRRSQPMEENRRRKLLDKSVELACPRRDFPSVK